MKHVTPITAVAPERAQDTSIGQIISVIAELLAVVGGFLLVKDQRPPTGGGS